LNESVFVVVARAVPQACDAKSAMEKDGMTPQKMLPNKSLELTAVGAVHVETSSPPSHSSRDKK